MATGYHGWFAVAAGGRQTLVDRPSFKQKGHALNRLRLSTAGNLFAQPLYTRVWYRGADNFLLRSIGRSDNREGPS